MRTAAFHHLLLLAAAAFVASAEGNVDTLNECPAECGVAPEPFSGNGQRGFNRGGEHKESAGDDDEDYYDKNYYNAERVVAASSATEKPSNISEDDARIVNGYEPDDRPWLVFIDVAGGACGGAILNHK